jgi:hypothetical protein
VVTGFVAPGRIKRGEADNKGSTIVGIALGVLAIIVGGAISLFIAYLFLQYQSCIDHAQGRAELAKCG